LTIRPARSASGRWHGRSRTAPGVWSSCAERWPVRSPVILSRVREIMSGPASSALVLLMLAGCLFLWIGVPLGWLWIGSQVQGSASLGTAMLVTMLGITATIFVVVIVLSWLNRRHAVLQERRNRPRGGNALEMLLVASAGIAIVGFGVWFFGFAGASPVPLNIGF